MHTVYEHSLQYFIILKGDVFKNRTMFPHVKYLKRGGGRGSG